METNDSGLTVRYDEKRCGWWVCGQGFDFFAYKTCDDEGNDFLECDSVTLAGDERVMHLTVGFGGAKDLSIDIVETAILNELKKYWA